MPQAPDYPEYLDAIELGEERTIRARIDELKAELQNLTKSLDHARRAKRILWVSGKDLETEVVRFLGDMRIKARPSDIAGEGFWVSDGVTPDWCIGEVRNTNGGNATKQLIAELMVRRAKWGKDEGAPALLVVNTYEEGKSLEDRDQPVPSDVSRRAVEDHVMVMRTLDLFRLHQRASTGLPTAEQLIDALKSGGGWFEVDPALNIKVHGAEEAQPVARMEAVTPFFEPVPAPQLPDAVA
jgi:hypothetical protein